VLISAAIHYKQYRTLVRPLLWLRDDMKLSAANDYRERVRPRGDPEFKEVAGYFNGLARDLADLYKTLEEKVISRSRELVRSERLASVGFLAAGVAHEINNPLSVISGYAELAAKSLRGVLLGSGGGAGDEVEAAAEAEALSSALEAQEIVREEAFRCKEITSRLLSLARGGGDGRQALCLDDVARQVTVLTKGLKNYRDRRVVLDFKADPLEVVANMTEMKQVLLNLTVNALEAVPPERGEVRIGGRRAGGLDRGSRSRTMARECRPRRWSRCSSRSLPPSAAPENRARAWACRSAMRSWRTTAAASAPRAAVLGVAVGSRCASLPACAWTATQWPRPPVEWRTEPLSWNRTQHPQPPTPLSPRAAKSSSSKTKCAFATCSAEP